MYCTVYKVYCTVYIVWCPFILGNLFSGQGTVFGGGGKGVGVLGVVGSLSEGGSRVGFQSKCTVDRYMAQLSNGVFIN